MAGIAQLNELPADKLREQLIICCTAEKWADQMVAKRPFAAASVHTVSDSHRDRFQNGLGLLFSAMPPRASLHSRLSVF
jgi:hypothetical protein